MQQIWTFQFLEVVPTSAVENVIYRLIENLTGFPAVK